MWTPRSPEALLALALVAGPAHPQGLDAQAERERIGGERAHIEARATAERQACRAQFAVSACIERVEGERRDRMRALDRQRALLDEAERKQRAIAREARIAERRRRDEAARAAPTEPAVDKTKPARKPAPADSPQIIDRARARALAASAAEAQATQRVQAAQRRKAEIEAHRRAVEQRNLAATRKPGVALPASAPN